MSPIIGTYTNASLNAKLVISASDDATGGITGNLTVSGQTWNINGAWNATSAAPGGIFCFSGASNNPASFTGGVGSIADFSTADSTTISISLSLKGGVVTTLSGRFVRS